MFDINDFDETLPGPWEWDVKRLAASFEVCGTGARLQPVRPARRRHRGGRGVSHESCGAPSKMRALDVWYDHVDGDEILAGDRRGGAAETPGQGRGEGGGGRTSPRHGPAITLRAFSKRADDRRTAVAVRGRPTADRADPRSCSARVRPRRARRLDRLPGQHLPATRSRGSTIRSRSTASSTPRARSSGSGASARMPGSTSSSAATTSDPLILQSKEAQPSVLERFLRREHLRELRPAGGRRPAPDAGGDRHLPRLVARHRPRRAAPRLLHPAAARLEGQRRAGDVSRAGRDGLRGVVRRDARPCPRALGRPDRDRHVSGQRRRIRPRDRPASPRRTPIRTSATTRRSPTPSRPAVSSPRPVSESV